VLTKRFKIGVSDVRIKPLMEYKEYIESFYVGSPVTGNCRSNYVLIDFFEQFIKDCEEIPVWVTANDPILNDFESTRAIDSLIGYWKQFKFHGYIASNIVVLTELKNHGIPVQVSTVMDIRDLNDIDRMVKMGFNDIVLSYKINRNMDFIKKAINCFPNTKFTLITNELCESNCPHRFAHFVTTCKGQNVAYQCPIRYPQDTAEWNTTFLQNTLIPPENLKDYSDKIIFKLPTRIKPFGIPDIIKHLRIYTGLDSYDNMYELVAHHFRINDMPPLHIDKSIFKNWLNCKNQCYECNVCRNEITKPK